jgi:hypothetical protein
MFVTPYMCVEKWIQHTPLIMPTQEYYLTIQFLKSISFKMLVCYVSFKALVYGIFGKYRRLQVRSDNDKTTLMSDREEDCTYE